MTKKRMNTLYGLLTSEERFKLHIEALARGDERETESLTLFAPRYAYAQTDAAYTSRLKASAEITNAVCSNLVQQMAKVRTLVEFSTSLLATHAISLGEAHLACLEAYEAGARAAWKKAGKEGDPPCVEKEGEDGQLEGILEGLQQSIGKTPNRFEKSIRRREYEIFVEAREIWEAFSNFSRDELGMEPKKLVAAWFESALEDIEALESVTEVIELDGKQVAEKEYFFKTMCNRMLTA